MKKLIMSIVMGFAMLFSMGSMASDLKIGVIDVHKLIEQSSEIKSLNARLKKEFQPRQQKIMAAQRSLQTKAERLKREAAVMSESEKANLQEKLVTERRDLQRMEQDYQQDISMIQNKEMKKFFTRLKSSVDKYAKKNRYDLILQKDAAPFASNKVDVTSAILKSMS